MLTRLFDGTDHEGNCTNTSVAVQGSAKFLELATKITLMILKFCWRPEKLPYYRALFKRNFTWNAPNLRSNFWANFHSKVCKNKERNSRILLALPLHNPVNDNFLCYLPQYPGITSEGYSDYYSSMITKSEQILSSENLLDFKLKSYPQTGKLGK